MKIMGFFDFHKKMENARLRAPGRTKAPRTIEIQSKFIGSGGVRSARKPQKTKNDLFPTFGHISAHFHQIS